MQFFKSKGKDTRFSPLLLFGGNELPLNGRAPLNLISTHHSPYRGELLFSSRGEASFKARKHFGIEEVRESLSARARVRTNEWLYKPAAAPGINPFERGSRINLIWRVARFVFEGLAEAESLGNGAGGDGGSAASRDFRYRRHRPCPT